MGKLVEYLEELETTKEYNGYFYSVKDVIIIVVLGSFCGLKSLYEIWEWTEEEDVKEFLKGLGIKKVPYYSWLAKLIGIIKPESLNSCFTKWVESLVGENKKDLTIAFDGKQIKSTGKMTGFDGALNIVSAYVAEKGITFGQVAVEGKSNEIPAMQKLIGELNLKGSMVVADALHCQRETAELIVEAEADYVFCVKGNQGTLEQDIVDYFQTRELIKNCLTAETKEINGSRWEERTAYACRDINWFGNKEKWKNLACIGVINRKVTYKGKTSNTWHYYISSRPLTAEELLYHVRQEWSVEAMHWLLDVHFNEDCCLARNKNSQQNLNMARKIALNYIKLYKERTNSNKSLISFMRSCYRNSDLILNMI